MLKPIIKTWKQMILILDAINGRKTFYWDLSLGTINGILDLVTFSSLIPLILYVASPKENIQDLPFYDFFALLLNDESMLFSLVWILVFSVLLRTILNIVIVKKQLKMVSRVCTTLSSKALKWFYNIDYMAFTDKSPVEVSNIIHTGPTVFANGVFLSFQNILSDVIVFLCIVSFLVFTSTISFGIALIIMIPLGIVLYILLQKESSGLKKDFKTIYGKSVKSIHSAIDNYVLIRLRNKNDFFESRYLNYYSKFSQLNARFEFNKIIPRSFFELFAFLVFTMLIFLLVNEFISPSQLIAFLSIFSIALYRIIPILTRTIRGLTSIQVNSFYVDLMVNAIDLKMQPAKTINQHIRFENNLLLDNVGFSYQEGMVFENVNLKIGKGEWIGISGASGVGKSTLLKLITGIIQPTSGVFSIDSIPLDENHQKSWYSKIGYLEQKVHVFDGTIAENILFGENPSESSLDEILLIVKDLGLESLISTKADLHKEMGSGGIKISGGQAKRIALARTLYHESEILILDEFTSDTDPETNLSLMKSLKLLYKEGKTILQVSHQEEAFVNCTERFHLTSKGLQKLRRTVEIS